MRAVAVLCSLLALGAAGARVQISAEGDSIYYIEPKEPEVVSYYGDTVTIFCSGTNATKINLTRVDSKDSEAIEIVNTTTVKLTSKDLAIGDYKYICDEETSRAELLVSIFPVLTVKSQNVLNRNLQNLGRVFFVPSGEDYEIFCSAGPQASLTITKNDEQIQTHVVNRTSIKTLKQQGMVNARFRYSCGIDYPRTGVIVYIDNPPAPINFHCVLFDMFHVRCNWNVRTLETTFTLFFSDLFRNTMRVCEVSSSENSIACEFLVFNLLTHGISLDDLYSGFYIMKSCNLFVCINETFNVNTVFFTRPNAPSNLTLQDMSASQAVIMWHVVEFWSILQYKVTYQTTGMAASELNESSLLVTCIETPKRTSQNKVDDCEAKLKLPCPRTRYEIKVYAKDSICPGTNDACWSYPGTITLYTGKRGNATVDPMCDQPIRNKYVAMNKIQEFEIKIDENLSALSEKVKSLKNKLDKIKKMCGELSSDDCKNVVLSKTGGK